MVEGRGEWESRDPPGGVVEERGSGRAGTLRAGWLKREGVGEQGPSGPGG